MAEVLMDFPQLSMTMPDGREESIMKRTTLVSLKFGFRVWVCRVFGESEGTCQMDSGRVCHKANRIGQSSGLGLLGCSISGFQLGVTVTHHTSRKAWS